MKLSELQIDDLKNYAHVYFNDDDNLFQGILIAAKSFVTNYTGLPLSRITTIPTVNQIPMGADTITGNSISGYTITVTYPYNVPTSTTTVQSDGTWTISVPTNVTLNSGDKVNITQTSPSGNVSAPTLVNVNSSLTIYPACADDFEDLSIALMVLSNEMYDNRSMTVDNNKLNFVVQTILDSHSVNLL